MKHRGLRGLSGMNSAAVWSDKTKLGGRTTGRRMTFFCLPVVGFVWWKTLSSLGALVGLSGVENARRKLAGRCCLWERRKRQIVEIN